MKSYYLKIIIDININYISSEEKGTKLIVYFVYAYNYKYKLYKYKIYYLI